MQFLGIEAIEISFEMRILLEIQIKYRFRAIREREEGGEKGLACTSEGLSLWTSR